ncbi:tetratricopeptide repeat protein [Treponema pedis]|uniref:tetratricopeptide repeat protein n=1 Tax=Treponema pedis TaxID=409322 RepID=UPI00041E2453|nr:tetratricopeptide repeat protein [Treponema pedis]
MKFKRNVQNMGFSREKKGFKSFFIITGILLCVSLSLFLFFKYKKNFINTPSMNSVYADWKNKDYEKVYKKTEAVLKKRPLDGEALAMHGFASYYLFAEQNDFSVSYPYLNEAILSLRQAMYRVKSSEKPKISYMLGKAYYQKGYYYADLAIKYLDYAYASDFTFKDLAEFRGMAASLLGDTEKAISAFTEALAQEPSDLLLFALAENYIKIYDEKNAKLYLFETIEKTKDTLLELKCRYLLGSLFLDEGKVNDAEKEFNIILEKDGTYADAHYGLGVVSEIRGDLIKARAEWRKAIKLNPLHEKTRVKLNLK